MIRYSTPGGRASDAGPLQGARPDALNYLEDAWEALYEARGFARSDLPSNTRDRIRQCREALDKAEAAL